MQVQVQVQVQVHLEEGGGKVLGPGAPPHPLQVVEPLPGPALVQRRAVRDVVHLHLNNILSVLSVCILICFTYAKNKKLTKLNPAAGGEAAISVEG